MKMMKKRSIVVGLLLVVVGNVYTMDAPAAPQGFTEGTRNLPGDVQGVIILQFIQTSDTLEGAVEHIKRLAFQNAELTKKLNEPAFCLQLIKTLAKKFKCSDKKAAEALGTKEAIRRIALQDDLSRRMYNIANAWRRYNPQNLGYIEDYQMKMQLAGRLREMINIDNVDMNFTDDGGKTPLGDLVERIGEIDPLIVKNLSKSFLDLGADPEAGTSTAIGNVKQKIKYCSNNKQLYEDLIKSNPENEKSQKLYLVYEKLLQLWNEILEMFEEVIANKHA